MCVAFIGAQSNVGCIPLQVLEPPGQESATSHVQYGEKGRKGERTYSILRGIQLLFSIIIISSLLILSLLLQSNITTDRNNTPECPQEIDNYYDHKQLREKLPSLVFPQTTDRDYKMINKKWI